MALSYEEIKKKYSSGGNNAGGNGAGTGKSGAGTGKSGAGTGSTESEYQKILKKYGGTATLSDEQYRDIAYLDMSYQNLNTTRDALRTKGWSEASARGEQSRLSSTQERLQQLREKYADNENWQEAISSYSRYAEELEKALKSGQESYDKLDDETKSLYGNLYDYSSSGKALDEWYKGKENDSAATSFYDYQLAQERAEGFEEKRQDAIGTGRGLGTYGKGNINLYERPQYQNEDGSISTVRSMSFNEDGVEILIPTIAFDDNGNAVELSDEEAIDRYHKTGEYLGKFQSVEEADEYAEKLHKEQERYYRDDRMTSEEYLAQLEQTMQEADATYSRARVRDKFDTKDVDYYLTQGYSAEEAIALAEQKSNEGLPDIESSAKAYSDAKAEYDYAWAKYVQEAPYLDGYYPASVEGEKLFQADKAKTEGTQSSEGKKPWESVSFDAGTEAADITLRSQEEYQSDTSYKEPQDSWTEAEKRGFYSIYSTDKETAAKYAEYINNSYNKAERETQAKEMSQWAYDHPVPGTLAEIGTGVMSLVSGISEFGDMWLENNARGTITQKTDMTPIRMNQALTEGATKRLNEVVTLPEELPVVGGKGLGDFLQITTSMAQSRTASATQNVPFLSDMMFFGMAAAQTTYDLLDRGVDPDKAMLTGTVAGLAEAITEHLSLESLMNLKTPEMQKGFASWLKDMTGNIAKQMASEGSEEMNSDVINLVAENLILGSDSEINRKMQTYLDRGMSYDEAKNTAYREWVMDTLYDGLTGALSGGMMAVGQAAIGTVQENTTRIDTKESSDLISMAEDMGTGKAYALAEKFAASGKELTIAQANKLSNAINDELLNQNKEATTKATEQRLQALGLQENAGETAAAIVASLSGERVNKSGKALLQNEIAQQVMSELDIKKETTGDRSWMKEIELYGGDGETFGSKSLPWMTVADQHQSVDRGDVTGTIKTVSADGAFLVELEDGTTKKVSIDDMAAKPAVRALAKAVQPLQGMASLAYNMYEAGQDITSYTKAMEMASMLAENGASYDRINSITSISEELTAEQLKAAVEYGQKQEQERKANAKKRQERLDELQKQKGEEKLKVGDGSVSYEGGTVEGKKYKGVDKSKLKGKKLLNAEITEVLAKETGLAFHIFDGPARAEQGFYLQGGEIWLNINAGNAIGKDLMLTTAAHELTHFIKEYAPEMYEDYRDVVCSAILDGDLTEMEKTLQAKGEELESRENKLDRYIKQVMQSDRSVTTREQAIDEVVANASEMMLKNSRIMELVAECRPTLAEKVSEFLGDFRKRMEAAFDGMEYEDARHEASRIVLPELKILQKRWDNALETAIRNRALEKDAKKAPAEAGARIQNELWEDGYFEEQLNDWIVGGGKKHGSYNGSYFKMGTTPDILIKHGAKEKKMIMLEDVIIKITGGKHQIALEEIAKLPQELNRPILLLKGSHEGSFVALTQIVDKQQNDVICSVHINSYHERMAIDKITSLYSKNDDNGRNKIVPYIMKEIENGNLLDADINKAPMWFTTKGLQLPSVVQTIIDANKKIPHEKEKSNTEKKKNIPIREKNEEKQINPVMQQAWEKALANKENKQKKQNSTWEDERELNAQEQKAVERFGTTEDFNEAGYILPNGQMLRFTDDSSKGERQYDHRAIGMIYGRDINLKLHHGFDEASGKYLNEFVDMGNIRFDTGTPELNMDSGIQLSANVPLTKAQEQRIRDFIEWKKNREEMMETLDEDDKWLYRGPLALHIEFGGDAGYSVSASEKDLNSWGVKSLNYEGSKLNASKVIADIRHYYETGEIRQQSSLARFYSTWEDENYLELAQDPEGNRTELERIVKDAAIKAGYRYEGYHGTETGTFTQFKGGLIYHAADRKTSSYYSGDVDSTIMPMDRKGQHDIEKQSFTEMSKYLRKHNGPQYKKLSESEAKSEAVDRFIYWNRGVINNPKAVTAYEKMSEYLSNMDLDGATNEIKAYVEALKKYAETMKAISEGKEITFDDIQTIAALNAARDAAVGSFEYGDDIHKKYFAYRTGLLTNMNAGNDKFSNGEYIPGTSADDAVNLTELVGDSYIVTKHGLSEGYSKKGDVVRLADIRKNVQYVKKFDPNITNNGIYHDYLKMDNPLVIDANGSQWEHISLKDDFIGTSKYHQYSTDEIGKWAKENGHDGVIIKNVFDYKLNDYHTTTDYIVFDSSQVKSAEPVVYDDDFEVIPISQRFNSENQDIRYSTWADELETARTELEEELNLYDQDYKTQRMFWNAYDAVTEVTKEKENTSNTLVRFGEMPGYILNLTGVGGDVYVRREHLYQNIASRKQAEEDGRKTEVNKHSAHFHELGIKTAIKALMSINDPIATIVTKNKKNPQIELILPVKDKRGNNLYAAISLYDERGVYGEFSQKPNIVITISPKEMKGDRNHPGIVDKFKEAIEDHRLIDLDTKKRTEMPVIYVCARHANITTSVLDSNLSQFRKEINAFKEKNKINYSTWNDEKSDRELVLEAAANGAEGIAADYRKLVQNIEKLNKRIEGQKAVLEKMNAEPESYSEKEKADQKKKVNTTQKSIWNAESKLRTMERSAEFKFYAEKLRTAWNTENVEAMTKANRLLNEENIRLQKYVRYLEEQTKQTESGKQKANEEDVRKFADWLVKHVGADLENQTELSADYVAQELQKLADYVVSNGNGDGIDSRYLSRRAAALAEEIARNTYVTMDENAQLRHEVRDSLRKKRIRITDSLRAEIADFNAYRKSHMGTLVFSLDEKAQNIADVYYDLQNEFPGVFGELESYGESDILEKIMDVVDALEPKRMERYSNRRTLWEISQYQGQMIVDTLLGPDIRQARTMADDYQRSTMKAMQDLREAQEETERVKATAARERAKAFADMDELDRRLNQRAELEVKAARMQMEERATARQKRINITKARNSLIRALEENGKQRRIPEAMKLTVAEFCKSIDPTSPLMGDKSLAKFRAQAAELDRVIAQQLQFYDEESGEIDNPLTLDLPQNAREMMDEFMKEMDKAIKEDQRWNIASMNVEQLEQLEELLTAMQHAVKTANELIENEAFKHVHEASQETIRESGELNALQSDGKLKRFIRKQINWNNTVPYYAFKRMGKAAQSMFKEIMNGWGKMAMNAKQVIDYAESLYDPKELKSFEENVFTVQLSQRLNNVIADSEAKSIDDIEKNDKAEPDTKREVKRGEEHRAEVKITEAQIMSLYALMKREQAVGHILGAGIRVGDFTDKKGKRHSQTENYLLSYEDAMMLISKLSPRAKQLVDQMQEYMNTVGSDWGNEVSMKRWGIRGFTEKNYWPIRTDENNRAARTPDKDSPNLYRLLNMGFTKGVVKKANNAIVLDSAFDVFANHMADMAKYNALALPMLDAMRWYNFVDKSEMNEKGQYTTSSVQKALERAWGKEAGSWFLKFMQDLNGSNEGGVPSAESGWKTIMSNYKVSAVAANVRVALQQPTSIFRALNVIDGKYLTKGVLTREGGREEALKYSGLAVWKDLGFFDTNINRSMRDMMKNAGGLMDAVRDKSMVLAEKGDQITWAALWNACRAEVMDKQGLKGEELMRATASRFDDLILATQVMDGTITRSENMRSKTVFMNQVTAFMSEPTLTYNVLLDQYMQIETEARRLGSLSKAWQANNGALRKKTFKTFMIYLTCETMTAAAAAIADAARDDDDYQTYWEKWLEHFVKNWKSNVFQPWNMIPLVKDVIGTLTGDTSDNMQMAAFNKVLNFGKILWEKYQLSTGALDKATKTTYYGNMTDYGMIYAGIQALSTTFGLPLSGAFRDAVAIWNTTFGTFLNKKLKTYDAGTEKNIKYAYTDGYLSYEEAEKLLIDNGIAKDKNDAYFVIEGWDGSGKFDAIKAAVKAGDESAYKSELKTLTDHGEKTNAAYSSVRSAVREWYQGTDKEPRSIDKETAIGMLTKYAGMDRTSAEKAVQEWTAKVVTGISYSDIKEAYINGDISFEQAVDYKVTYGGSDRETAKKSVTYMRCEKETGIAYDDLKQEYRNGNISAATLKKCLMTYGGKTEKEADEEITAQDFVKKYPKADGISAAAVKKYGEYCAGTGLDGGTFYTVWKGIWAIDSDRDEDGKAIRNTKRDKVIAYIDSLPLTSEQKTAVFKAAGYTSYSALRHITW